MDISKMEREISKITSLSEFFENDWEEIIEERVKQTSDLTSKIVGFIENEHPDHCVNLIGMVSKELLEFNKKHNFEFYLSDSDVCLEPQEELELSFCLGDLILGVKDPYIESSKNIHNVVTSYCLLSEVCKNHPKDCSELATKISDCFNLFEEKCEEVNELLYQLYGNTNTEGYDISYDMEHAWDIRNGVENMDAGYGKKLPETYIVDEIIGYVVDEKIFYPISLFEDFSSEEIEYAQ